LTFWDFLPTVADIAGIDVEHMKLDGVSALPTLLGQEQDTTAEVYFEFCGFKESEEIKYDMGWT